MILSLLLGIAPAFAADGAASPAASIDRPTAVTTTTADDYLPSLTPDGRSVVYVSDRKGNPDLFLRYLPGSGAVGDYPLTFHTARDTSPSVSPTGEQVAFVSFRSDVKGDLYVLNLRLASRIPEKIRERLYERFGTALSEPGSETARVANYLVSQGELVRLTDEAAEEIEPAWGPNGDRIYFTRSTGGSADIYLLRLPGREIERVVRGGSMPAPSPDGRSLAYVAADGIRLLDLSTGRSRPVTDRPFDLHPTFSDRGDQIFFSRYAEETDGDGRITIADRSSIHAAFPSPHRLTSGETHDLFPDQKRGRVVVASRETTGLKVSNLRIFPASGLFSRVADGELLRLARDLEETEPHLAALACEEAIGRGITPAEAGYRLGLVADGRLAQSGRARSAWSAVAASGEKRWALLSRVELLRLENLGGTDTVPRLLAIAAANRAGEASEAGARALLEAGRAYARRGEDDRAVATFDRVVAEHPEEEAAAAALLEKTGLYEKFGDTPRLLAGHLDLLRRYPSAEPYASTAAQRIVDLWLATSATEASKDAKLRDAAATYASVPILPALSLNVLGDRAMARKEREVAAGFYRSVIDGFPKEERQKARARLSLARLRTEEGDYDAALSLFREAEREVPANDPWRKEARHRFVGSLLAKGRGELSGNDFRAAVRTFKDLVAFDFEIPQAHRGLIAAHAALGEIPKVLSLYREERKRRPDHYLPRYALGLAHTYEEPPSAAFDRAEPELLEAISLDGRALFPHQTLGFVYEKREELLKQPDYLPRALDQYAIARSLSDPADDFQNHGDLTLNLGNGYFLLGDFSKAYQFYAERRSFDLPFDPRAQKLVFLERFSRSAFQIERYDESVSLADEALALLNSIERGRELPPREILSHRAEISDARSLSLASAGRHEEAARGFTEVAALNRKLGQRANEAKAFRNLALNLFETPRKEGAEEERRLADARDAFDESFELLGAHGVSTTEGKRIGSLVNVSQEVALGDDSSEAAKGFSERGERELLDTFLARLEKERGRYGEALEALDRKRAALSGQGSILTLKSSILANQRGILLAALGRRAEAASEFERSYEGALSLSHEVGMARNALSLARLRRHEPSPGLFAKLDEAFGRLVNRGDPDAALLAGRIALERLGLAEASALPEPSASPAPPADPLTESLRRIRVASSLLAKGESKGADVDALLLELDIAHFRWTGHAVSRDDELERRGGALKRDDLVLRARCAAVSRTEPFDPEPVVSFLGGANPASLRPALDALVPILVRWEEEAVSAGNGEEAFDAAEWRSWTALQAFRTADGGVVGAAELMEMLGPDRAFVRRLPTSRGTFRLIVRSSGLTLERDDSPIAKPPRDLYVTDRSLCPEGQLCSVVASASHLFHALGRQGLFDRKVYLFADSALLSPPRQGVAWKNRTDLAARSGRADSFLAPVPLGNDGRFELPLPEESRFEREIPVSLLRESGVSTVVLPPSPFAPLDLLTEWWARGGIATVIVAPSLPEASDAIRPAERARRAGLPVYGALGLTASEREEMAEMLLGETVERGAGFYRDGRWGEATRSFDDALHLLDERNLEESAGITVEQLLDVAGTAAYRADDPDAAIRYTKRLVEIRRKSGPPEGTLELANALQFLGVLHSRDEKFSAAVAELTEASRIYQALGASPEKMAESLSTLGIVHENANRFKEAISFFDRSLEIHAKQAGVGTGEQWRRIGRIHYLRLNDYAKAEEAFQKAVAIFTAQKDLPLRDEALLETGLVKERRGSFEEARKIYRAVFDRAKSPKAALYVANTYWFEGNYDEAFRWQRTALKRAEETNDDRLRLLCHSTVGLIYWTLNQHDKAIEEQGIALELARKLVSPIDEAAALNNTGLVYREKGDLEKSISFFKRALAVDRKLKSPWGMSYDLRNLGISETRLKRYPDALKHLTESLRLSESIGARENQAKALHALGDLHLARNRLDDAFDGYKKALLLSREINLKEIEWRSLYGLARITRSRKNPEGALVYLREGIDVVEKMGAAIRIEEFRNSFVTNKLSLYQEIVLALLERGPGSWEEAWSYAERARSRSFIDLLGNRNVPVAPADRLLLERDRKSRRDLDGLENRLAATTDVAERKKIAEEIEAERRNRENLLIEIRASRPELSAFVTVDVLTLAELQRLLGNDTAFVEYFVMEKELLAWVITDKNLELVRVRVPKRILEGKVVDYSRKMQETQPLLKESEELYRWVFQPLEKHLSVKRFVGISPHEALHYLSFASLFDGKRFVVDRHPLFYSPSASVLKFTLKDRKIDKANARVLAIGNPDLGNPALDLPFSEKEVGAITRNFPRIETLTREKATERWVAANLGSFDVIHLAAHGEFDPVNPLFSAIKLAPTKTSPGDLQVEEIFSLKSNADLVTLSACQTGLAKIEGGGELIGLNRAFLYAGTHSILSSLWRVSDVSTAILVKHFYRNYLTETKAESLRKAQLLVKDYYPHPAYWGAFSLTGDYR